jgi:hypothetical protein
VIVDGYCDVCGSRDGAVPFVPAAVSAASPVPADEPGPTAVPALTPAAAPVNEEIPPQRISRVKMSRQQLSTQETVDLGAADPVAVDARQVDREKVGSAAADIGKVDAGTELAEGEPVRRHAARGYRTRVEEARLPDNVRQAALCEVGKLERTSDQSPESGDIRTWLDTILDLPWSTKTTDWIEHIQGSPEVEATLRRLIEPVAADLEEADTAEVEPAAADLAEGDTAEGEPAAADLEKADTAPGGLDDTGKMPAVAAAVTGGRQHPQLPEQPVGPEPVRTPAKKRRFGYLALAATALAALLIGALLYAAGRDRGVTAQSVPTVTATATATATKPTSKPTIQLQDLPDPATPFQTVRIEGTYRGGADTFLYVQRWEEGKWLAFPVPTKTDKSGKFTTFIELGQPGRYRLRILDPDSGLTSKPFVMVIKG